MVIDFNDLNKPYLIGEIGINHNGDLKIAKKLLDACHACGWDCAKFQKRTPEIAIPEGQKNILKDTPWGEMTYLKYKEKIEFSKREYDYIEKYCSEKPLDWSMSVWDLKSLEFSIKYDIPFIKIPSALITNDELIIESSNTGLPLIVSTGMSTLIEVDHAVNILEEKAKSYALLHSNSTYPAATDELNLNTIPYFIERYKCTVGYSGHEYGLTPTVIAVSLGAKIIERHITLSHHMWGTDQSASIEITGMDMIVKRIKSEANVLGKYDKILFESELVNRKKLRGD
tara:strand:+ start:1048 stop:1902 length:855 start_codon:yes stop_codon:yes gene_type:complete